MNAKEVAERVCDRIQKERGGIYILGKIITEELHPVFSAHQSELDSLKRRLAEVVRAATEQR
jgi:hypothetical protein